MIYRCVHFLLILTLSLPASANQFVRIAVTKSAEPILLQGEALEIQHATSGETTRAKEFRFAPSNAGILVNGKSSGEQVIRVVSPGRISLGKKEFREELEVRLVAGQNREELLVVHPLLLETYVAGIIAAEVPKSFSKEAQKAQAIAARTYAMWQKYRRLDEPYHLDSSVLNQVYKGAHSEHALANLATKETDGLVLTFKGKLVPAYFHASCGDHTESAEAAFGARQDFLPGVYCGYCKGSNAHDWKLGISKDQLSRKVAGLVSGSVKNIQVVARTPSGRAKWIEVTTSHSKKRISATDFRRAVGYDQLRSTWITHVEVGRNDIRFVGKGHGHGVGMCQWGANGMAAKGKSAHEIVARYYPGSEIRKIY